VVQAEPTGKPPDELELEPAPGPAEVEVEPEPPKPELEVEVEPEPPKPEDVEEGVVMVPGPQYLPLPHPKMSMAFPSMQLPPLQSASVLQGMAQYSPPVLMLTQQLLPPQIGPPPMQHSNRPAVSLGIAHTRDWVTRPVPSMKGWQHEVLPEQSWFPMQRHCPEPGSPQRPVAAFASVRTQQPPLQSDAVRHGVGLLLHAL